MIRKKMKNTKKEGSLHIRIFKWNGRYIGICKETGFVEESESFEVVKRKLINGIVALIGAVNKSKQNLEPSINTTPPFKYLVYFYIAPVLAWIEGLKDSSTEYDFSSLSIRKLQAL